ncbi:MAG: type II secretion system F family protein [Clostridiales bacterium]|nr:type II secretion system F family protein [Clostridiales bacterium]
MQLFIGFSSLTGFVIGMGLLFSRLMRGKRRNVIRRLEVLEKGDYRDDGVEPMSLPFYNRAVLPVFDGIGGFFRKLTPRRMSKNIDKKMWLAGYTNTNRVNQFFTIQSIWIITLPAIVAMLLYLLKADGVRILVLTGLTLIVAILFPNLLLNRKIISRKERIKKDLPNAIDFLVVSVEAGLAFDMAVEKVTEEISGPIAQEFGYTLNEIRMGKSRVTAFRELGERTGSDELASFIGAIIQADQMGVSIGSVLRIQSDSMRVRRRQFLEELSMKAPVKMLIPLVFFILPPIFVVILGPAIINLIKLFTGME